MQGAGIWAVMGDVVMHVVPFAAIICGGCLVVVIIKGLRSGSGV